jgi:energy-converting hydrogenase Eha subunit C
LTAASRLTQLSIVSKLRNLWKVAVACALMALGVLLLRHALAETLIPLLELGLVATVGAALYISALFALGIRWKDVTRSVE